jgi:hypothetical protein
MFTRTCPLPECHADFQTDNPRKGYCCTNHAARDRMRRKRTRDRKNGGGDDGGGGGDDGGGGGESPTLFDTITPQDSRAIYVFDTCYRTPEIPARRKPPAPSQLEIPGLSARVA